MASFLSKVALGNYLKLYILFYYVSNIIFCKSVKPNILYPVINTYGIWKPVD